MKRFGHIHVAGLNVVRLNGLHRDGSEKDHGKRNNTGWVHVLDTILWPMILARIDKEIE